MAEIVTVSTGWQQLSANVAAPSDNGFTPVTSPELRPGHRGAWGVWASNRSGTRGRTRASVTDGQHPAMTVP